MAIETVSLCDLVVSLAAPAYVEAGFKRRKRDLLLRTEETDFILLFPRGRNRPSSSAAISFRIEANIRKLDAFYRSKNWKERLDLLDSFDAHATYRDLSGDNQHLGHWYLDTQAQAEAIAAAIDYCLDPVIGFIGRFSSRDRILSELQARHRTNSESSANLELRYLVYLHQVGDVGTFDGELDWLKEHTQNNARARSQIARMLTRLGSQAAST